MCPETSSPQTAAVAQAQAFADVLGSVRGSVRPGDGKYSNLRHRVGRVFSTPSLIYVDQTDHPLVVRPVVRTDMYSGNGLTFNGIKYQYPHKVIGELGYAPLTDKWVVSLTYGLFRPGSISKRKVILTSYCLQTALDTLQETIETNIDQYDMRAKGLKIGPPQLTVKHVIEWLDVFS